MSYLIITHRDAATVNASIGVRRMYIVDTDNNAVVAEIVAEDGGKRLVALANRAEDDAAEEAKERTRRAGEGG